MRHFCHVLVFCASIAIVTTNARSVDDHENWPIPSGYTVPWPGHGSYRVYNEAKKWSKARSKCEEDGAELAIINSRSEALYVRRLIADVRPFMGSAYPGAWVGFRDIDSHGNWRTLNDESLNQAGYTHWWPRSARGFGMCGTIKTCGRLDAVDCNDSLIIICEYNGSLRHIRIMAVMVKDPHGCKPVCYERLKNSCCHPCCPPTCCYPIPPDDDPCFSCCKRIPPKCISAPKISQQDICPPNLVPHSGPLPCRACYDCPSTACCPPTFAGCRK